MQYTTHSQLQTINLGKKISPQLRGGDVVLLYSELGAGKTTLVKGIANGFGIKKNITSPTFTLMNVYDTKRLKDQKIKRLVHIDTYRLKNEKELVEIGAEDYIGAPDTVCVIEWPEKLHKLLKNKKTLRIEIEHLDKNKRKLNIKY